MESENREGLVCPECGSVVSEDDINIRADLAHCRACGIDFSYAGGRFLQACETRMAKPPPKHFEVEWKKQFDGSVDLHLAHRGSRVGAYGLLVFLFAILAGFSFVCWSMIRDGQADKCPPIAFLVTIVTGFLLYLISVKLRRLEVAMAGGKGRVWVYSLFRGNGRAFDYNAQTEFAIRGTQTITGNPVVTEIHIRNGTEKTFVVKYVLSKEEEIDYLCTALTYALPRCRGKDLEPRPDSPETPAEAAARRVEEANAAKARKWAKWGWVRFFAIVAVAIGLRMFLERGERTKREQLHLAQVVRAFTQDGDYRAVARKLPKRATADYRARLTATLVDFDAVSSLYRDCSKAEGLDVKAVDAILAKCVAITNGVARRAMGPDRDCIQFRCKALIEACQSAKSFLEKSPDPQNRVNFKLNSGKAEKK